MLNVYLAAWMTVRSWTLDTEPTVMLFRSPRSTQPYHTLACGAYNRNKHVQNGHRQTKPL